MRAMRAALLSVRSVRALPVLAVLSRSSARAPSRLVSTDAAAEGSIGSKSSRLAASRGDRLVKEMTPIATFLGIVVTVGAVGAYYSSRLSALEERVAGSEKTLQERVAGSEKTLQERVAGIIKEVDAKNTGIKDAVTKDVDAKIAGFKEVADLKVRFLMRTRLRALPTLSLTCLPLPLAVQDQVTGSSPSPLPSSHALAALVAVQKQR